MKDHQVYADRETYSALVRMANKRTEIALAAGRKKVAIKQVLKELVEKAQKDETK